MGFTDLALFYVRPNFGDAAWEFAAIAQTFDAMPLPTLGLILLALAARAKRSLRLSRALSIVFVGLGVGVAALLVLFVLDVPPALKALRAASGANPAQAAAMGFALKQGVGKAVLFGVCYLAALALLARTLWTKR